jgi:hypothetical protein
MLPKCHDLLIDAVKGRQILRFSYGGYARIVQPQTYGMTRAGGYVLRAYQTSGGSRSGRSTIAKLFDVAKISKLEKSHEHFAKALPSPNPHDSAMRVILATLPSSSK